jgi:hypothetical protein
MSLAVRLKVTSVQTWYSLNTTLKAAMLVDDDFVMMFWNIAPRQQRKNFQ